MKPDACSNFIAAATGRDGQTPTDTLTAAISIAHNMAYKAGTGLCPARCVLSSAQGKQLRPTPFLPYQSFASSAWVLSLKFTGGGYTGGAKVMFDSKGNAWSGANFIVGSVGHDSLWTAIWRSSRRTAIRSLP